MKPRILYSLLGMASAVPFASANTIPPPTTEFSIQNGIFTDSSYVLDSDESLINPNWTGDPTSETNTISFDGQGEHSLILEKNSSGTTADFIQIGTNSSRHQGSGTVAFENLANLSLKNSNGESSKGGAISIYQTGGNGSVEFSKIAGNISIQGFRPEMGNSSILVASDKGNSSISFSDIGGNISISDNKQTSGMPIGGAALTAWVDVSGTNPYTPYKASVSFSNVKGNIDFSNNASRYAGGAINAASFNGQAQVSFSNIQGNTIFSGNSSYQGGAIHIQGFYDSTQEDVSLTYTDSTGNVVFSNNSAGSGGAVSVTGINQTIKFSGIKGNVAFEGNSATNSGGAILLGDYTLGPVSPISSYQFPDLTRNTYARLEFSNIEGNVAFLNNSVNTANGRGKGGAIYIGDTRGYSPTYVVLSADKGNITFSGNTVDNTANAIHLEGQTFTYLRAQEGHSVSFFDPITTNTGTLAKYEKYNIYINKVDNGTEYNGRVVFSGANINAQTLGGDPATLETRLANSKTSRINGNIYVYDGSFEITEGAIVHCNSAKLYAGSTLEISQGGELKLSLNGAANQSLTVDSGAILMTGDTTAASSGDGRLETSTGISGGILQITDGAILGTFVHDTGKTSKDAIISSMKESFGTSTHSNTSYLYQIGKNVELEAIESIGKNEILNATDGGTVSISTIESGGMAIADQGGNIFVESIEEGGILSVSSGTINITEQATSTLGSFGQNDTEGTTAQIRVDSSAEGQSVINAASTDLKTVENETTTINSNTTIIAKSIEVSSSQPNVQTTLVNDGTINSVVKASGDGVVVKGSGTFAGGLMVSSGGTLIVGNSPGLQIYSSTVDISGSKVIFSVDGFQQATQTSNGWGSGTYSNIQMSQGTFRWDPGTVLGLELSSSLSSLSPGTPVDLVLMTFKVGGDPSASVTEITLGNQTIWNGTLYEELAGSPIGIEVLQSLKQSGDNSEFIQNLKDSKLVSSYDEELGIIELSLQGLVANKKFNDRSRALAEGRVASMAHLNMGADLIADQGIAQASIHPDKPNGKFNLFAAMAATTSQYDTGSHIDLYGYSALVGASMTLPSLSSLNCGLFAESGWGHYSSWSNFEDGAVRGSGSSEYYGGGIMTQYDFSKMGIKGLSVDASFRTGKADMDFASGDLPGSSYSLNTPYYGIHAGVNYSARLSTKFRMANYARFFWNHLDGDYASIDGSDFRFRTMDSQRIKAGTRVFYETVPCLTPYAGASYEWECSGTARAIVNGENGMAAPSLRGGTGTGELGAIYQPMENRPFWVDFSVQGHIGERQGISGTVRIRAEF